MSELVYVTKESLWNFLGLEGEPAWDSIEVAWDNLNQAVAITVELAQGDVK